MKAMKKKLKAGMEVVEKLNFLSHAGSAISDDFRQHTIETLFGGVWTSADRKSVV